MDEDGDNEPDNVWLLAHMKVVTHVKVNVKTHESESGESDKT